VSFKKAYVKCTGHLNKVPKGWYTTTEVAAQLGLWRQHAADKLERMLQSGVVEKRFVPVRTHKSVVYKNIWRVKKEKK
jgi:hypothetical protein